MFRRRLAHEFAAAHGDMDWRHGQHRQHRHARRWRRRMFLAGALAWQMRRKGFGRGGPWSAGAFEGRGAGERFFGRGDLKYVLLTLLQERPMHGYEMIKELQERTGGRYTASPGSVYPTLQMLEDRSFVTIEETEGKKVYSITAAGREFLAERKVDHEEPHDWSPFRHHQRRDSEELRNLRHDFRSLGATFGPLLWHSQPTPQQIKRLRDLIKHLRSELTSILNEADQAQDDVI